MEFDAVHDSRPDLEVMIMQLRRNKSATARNKDPAREIK